MVAIMTRMLLTGSVMAPPVRGPVPLQVVGKFNSSVNTRARSYQVVGNAGQVVQFRHADAGHGSIGSHDATTSSYAIEARRLRTSPTYGDPLITMPVTMSGVPKTATGWRLHAAGQLLTLAAQHVMHRRRLSLSKMG